MTRVIVAALVVVTGAASAGGEEPTHRVTHRVHVEVDPFPFAVGGYGGQVGYRGKILPSWRFAVASFALDVPDAVAELGGNEGWSIRVRPSIGVYAFHYFGAQRGGFAVGASLRYLRYRYSRDDVGSVDVGQVSAEALAAYKWHPFAAGFFVQPWGGLALTIAETDEPTVGDQTYDSLPLGVFATVNIGWELSL